MFTSSWKALKKGILLALLVAVMLAVLVFSAMQTAENGAVATLADGSDNTKRIAFLAQYGWQVSEEPIEIEEVAIPLQFGEVYQNYNAIQLVQNCDLEAYRGKVVRRYTYSVLNYPETNDPVRANLLVYEGEIVGGDICSLRLDGFMHGFAGTRQMKEGI